MYRSLPCCLFSSFQASLWIIIPILPIGTWNLGQEMSKEGSQDLNPGDLTLYIGPFWIGTLPTNGEVATDEDSVLF